MFGMDILRRIINGLDCESVEYKTVREMFENACYRLLADIRDVLADPSTTDEECFVRVERLVSLYEAAGGHCGARHDF